MYIIMYAGNMLKGLRLLKNSGAFITSAWSDSLLFELVSSQS